MTREEEVEIISERYGANSLMYGKLHNDTLKGLLKHYQEGFVAGVKWADKHPKNEWISVEDSLPEQDEEVIVLCDDLNVASFYKISFGHIVDKTICQDYNGWNIPNVVYWFPMPKLPKE